MAAVMVPKMGARLLRTRERGSKAGTVWTYNALNTDHLMAPELSIVIPVHNESPNIPQLYEELTQVLGQYGRSYELVIVDDGSVDDTFDQLAVMQARDARLRVIRFRRNFGQTAAFAAGFAHARGRLVVTSDGDLQNDPRDIPAMVSLIEQGNDIGSAGGKIARISSSLGACPACSPTN